MQVPSNISCSQGMTFAYIVWYYMASSVRKAFARDSQKVVLADKITPYFIECSKVINCMHPTRLDWVFRGLYCFVCVTSKRAFGLALSSGLRGLSNWALVIPQAVKLSRMLLNVLFWKCATSVPCTWLTALQVEGTRGGGALDGVLIAQGSLLHKQLDNVSILPQQPKKNSNDLS